MARAPQRPGSYRTQIAGKRQGRMRTRLAERPAQRQLRRLLDSARDELVRAGVKASLSGIGVLALYWWNHHN